MKSFSEQMLENRYLQPGETIDQFYRRVAFTNADNEQHGKRIYDYMKKQWFMPATPILSNSNVDKGLPISCFLNVVDDSRQSIFDKYFENMWIGANGGGIGSNWSRVREIGADIAGIYKSSGIIPFLRVADACTHAVSQGGVRRASQAIYLDVDHPEIEEFIELRKASGADYNRRCFNLHHAVTITDKFMEAVLKDEPWDLISRKDGSVVKTVNAFELFTKILTTRIETGEPYLFFKDNANRQAPPSYHEHGFEINMSNLCTEIMQRTTPDVTAVCALSSVNLAKWDEWHKDSIFIEDIVRFLDNVLTIFYEKSKQYPGYECARRSVEEERNIGIGVMGFHTYLQEHNMPFESALAASWNRRVFEHLNKHINEASIKLGKERGVPKYSYNGRRNNLTMAVAPTSSISIICGEVSPGIEPLVSNVFTHRNITGTRVVYNKQLNKVIKNYAEEHGLSEHWIQAQWKSITEHEGSVQHLEWMDDYTKDVYKTAYEIDQRWIIEHAATRQPYIDQGQSVNLFLYGDTHKLYLFQLHVLAWKKGLKSLYYLRSTAPIRAKVGNKIQREQIFDYDECLACQ